MNGQTISHYQILEKLGEGGMGVVYKATDTKLDRTVALKFLPAHLAASEADKSRFVQEAKAASSLNHPNVCTIHDIQEHDGQMFIVMEFVDGQTLREKKGAVTFKQAVDLGIQIADGLSAAHEKGIVHRDLKPDNIMVRKDGIAQIMDFGLAKLHGAVSRLTKEGSTVGTAGYMSPEQIQGQDVDHRSDIFSLGVLLYELFTGQLPFKGVHETALQYEIVNVDAPPMATVRPDTDPALDAIVLECLEKDPRDRYQSVAEVGKDLRKFKRESSRQRVSRVTGVRPVFDGSTASQAALPAQPNISPRKLWVAYGAAALFLVAAGILAVMLIERPEPVEPVIRSTILPPGNFRIAGAGTFALSPDGTKLAFVATDSSGERKIWVRSLHSFSSLPLPGTENAYLPFWSPDNRHIGFFADKSLKKTEAGGGGTSVVCVAASAAGGSWSDDGNIFFSTTTDPGLQRVPSQGGTPVPVAAPSKSGDIWEYPVVLPGGKAVLYHKYALVAKTSADTEGIYVRPLGSGAERLLVPHGSNPLYANGYLLYMLERSQLMAQPFDFSSLELHGEAVLAVEQVKYFTRVDKGNVSVSQNGMLVYQEGSASVLSTLVIQDRSGKILREFEKRTVYDDPLFSRDGATLAVTRYDEGAQGDLWTCDMERGTMSRITSDPVEEDDPVWSQDGASIIYAQDGQIVRKASGGAGPPEVLYESPTDKVPYDVSRDGKYLLFADISPKTRRDLWVLPLEGDRKPIPVAVSEFMEINGQFSPDGQWIAYSSNETGRNEVYVRSFRGTEKKWPVSTQGAVQPRWTRAGKEITCVDLNGDLFAVEVSLTGGSFHVGTPKLLFKAEIATSPVRPVYDITGDGQRVATIKAERGRSSLEVLNLVQNWTNILRAQ